MTTAVAILVKTPRLSPVKTRLASAIGESRAHAFHRLSALATAASLARAAKRFPDRLAPYWAVAEDDARADAEWSSFPIIRQGPGSFADRLHRLYGALRSRHESVVLAAAGSPEIPTGVWLAAWRALTRGGSVLGPDRDGGFYLAGSAEAIEEEVWRSVPYGTSDAGLSLANGLRRFGEVRWLPPFDGIDRPSDFDELQARLERSKNLPEDLARLSEWMRVQPATGGPA